MTHSRYVILTDFGSTYTKVVVADMQERRLIKTDHFPSTVATDARVGLQQCFDVALGAIGKGAFSEALKLSSSSAAGGLRMGVIGLSKTLSLEAGRGAAFGAGAKILKTCAGRLTDDDIQELCSLPLEILLFCGGYERGSFTVMEHNAEMLAKSTLHMPIIYAGNSAVSSTVRRLFTLNRKEFYVVRNIIPNVGKIDKTQVEDIIRDVFLKRIINMKGLDKVASMLDRFVMPTPAAVLHAGELLARGTSTFEGLGDMMIIDVGGATSDIHSYAEQVSYEGSKIVGAIEPYTKRTVEGDLGMRESSNSLCAEIGLDCLCREVGALPEEIEGVIGKWITQNRELAQTDLERKVDLALARGAVRISGRRHAGHIEHISSAGLKTAQHGKNLTGVRALIGTGGPIIFGDNPRKVLSEILRDPKKEPDVLLPEASRLYLDRDYVFFAGGLLREVDEDVAFQLMKNSLEELK